MDLWFKVDRYIRDVIRELYEKDELPPELSWIEYLSRRAQREFYGELGLAKLLAETTGDTGGSWESVIPTLNRWYFTAYIEASPELRERLIRPPGEYVAFDKIRR